MLNMHSKCSWLVLSLLNIPKSCLEAHLLLPLYFLLQPWPGRGITFPQLMNSHCGAGSVFPSIWPLQRSQPNVSLQISGKANEENPHLGPPPQV